MKNTLHARLTALMLTASCATAPTGKGVETPVINIPEETPPTTPELEEIQSGTTGNIKRVFIEIAVNQEEKDCYESQKVFDFNSGIPLGQVTSQQYSLDFAVQPFGKDGRVVWTNIGPYEFNICIKGSITNVEASSSSVQIKIAEPQTITVHDATCSQIISKRFYCTPIKITDPFGDENMSYFITTSAEKMPDRKFQIIRRLITER